MDFNVSLSEYAPEIPVRVGNVYPVKGGRGLRDKHMQVVVAITDGSQYQGPMCLMIVLSKEGRPVNVNSYGVHYVQDLMPIGFCHGLEEMKLNIGSI